MLFLPSDHFLNIHFPSLFIMYLLHLLFHCLSPPASPQHNLSLSLPHCCQMGKPPCCDKSNVKRGLWTAEEDAKILAYVSNHGVGNWTLVPKKAGLNRCGKSCRLRWTNYLRPDLRHDSFSPQEEDLIIKLHQAIGSRWSLIAKQLPGRTDNDVKNYWNTKLRKKLSKMGIDPITHKPFSQILFDYGSISSLPNTAKPVASFNNRSFNTTLMAKSQPSPEIPTPNINMDNSSATNHPFSWSFLGQFQNPTQVPNPHFFNEVTSSSSSSSSSFNGSDILFHFPAFPKQSTDPSSCSEQSHGIQSLLQSCNGVAMEEGFGSVAGPVSQQSEASSSSSSFNSFVEALLEQDIEMKGSFPELLEGCFDY